MAEDLTGGGNFSSYNGYAQGTSRMGTSQDVGSGSGGLGATPGFGFNTGADKVASQVSALDQSLQGLQQTVMGLSQSQASMQSGINSLFGGISSQATQANAALNQGALGGMMGSSSFSGYNGVPTASAGGSMGGFTDSLKAAFQSSGRPGLGATAQTLTSILAAPIRYAYDRIEENRMNTMGMAQALGPVASLTGRSIPELMSKLANEVPVQGNINEILGATSIGAATGYGNLDGGGRSGAYFTALREMQAFTPAVGATQLAGQFSGFLGNTSGQQRAMMLTGGAMSGFGPGGQPKTLREWAEGLLRWFEGLRPGRDRGKPFTKEEFEVQMFPGSNMDAWMNVNGVPDYMRNYFWQYGMTKANMSGSTGGEALTLEQMGSARGEDLAYARLRLNSASARREFELSSAQGITGLMANMPMYDAYVRREQADTGFTDLLRHLDKLLGSVAGPAGGLISGIPSPLADLGANMITEQMPNYMGNVFGMVPFIGDPGYGPYGGTSTANMDPSFGAKVAAMMDANPNLRITSGFRGGDLQGKLNAAGVGMVAPAGQSMHSRGLAADLGPSSEFGWIAANASAFGLESGVGYGEPWHVGAPGTLAEVGDPIPSWVPGSDTLNNAWDAINIGVAIDTNESNKPNRIQGPPSGLPGDNTYAATGVTPRGNESGFSQAWNGFQDVADSIGDKIGGLANALNPMNAIGGIVDSIAGVFAPLQALFSFMGNAFQGVTGLLSGDLTSLFGGGGLFDVSALGKNIMGGMFDLFGLPDFLNPAKLISGEMDFSDPASVLGFLQGGVLGPQKRSSVDWSQTAATGAGAGGAGGASWSGGSTGPANLQSIFAKYNGGSSVGGASLTPEQQERVKAALAAAASGGFKGDELVAITAIAGRESNWDPRAFNGNTGTGDQSYGLYQINMLGAMGPERRKQFGISSNEELFDPMVSGRAAYTLTGGGTNFSPWGGYKGKNALYNAAKYVEPVYNIAKQGGFIGDPRRNGGQIAGNTVVNANPVISNMSSTPVNITNQFTITSSGGEADAQRVAYVIADHLADQADQILVRTH